MPFSGSLCGVMGASFGGLLTLSTHDWVFTELFIADSSSLTTCISLNPCTVVFNSTRLSFSGDTTVLRSSLLEIVLSRTRYRLLLVTHWLHISRRLWLISWIPEIADLEMPVEDLVGFIKSPQNTLWKMASWLLICLLQDFTRRAVLAIRSFTSHYWGQLAISDTTMLLLTREGFGRHKVAVKLTLNRAVLLLVLLP